MDNSIMKLVDIKPAYDFTVGEVIFVDGREARGYGTVTEVAWDEAIKPADENPPNETEGRPFPPHIRVKMNGKRIAKTGSGKFLFHQCDLLDGKLTKLSDIDFQ